MTIVCSVFATILGGTYAFSEFDSELELNSVSEFAAYTHDPSNGLIRMRNVKGIEFAVQYLPTGTLVERQLRHVKDFDKSLTDRFKQQYEKSLGFEFSFGADGVLAEGDATYLGIHDYSEYAARVKTINFELDQLIELQVGSKRFVPKLALAENTYSLSKTRKVLVMFSDHELNDVFTHANECTFVFDDRIFNNGILKFRFDISDILSMPEFPYASLQRVNSLDK